MRVLHIAAYNRNVGDNIAIINARKSWEEHVDNIIWLDQDVGQYWNPQLTIQNLINHFQQISQTVDAILVGGGGLVEYGGYEHNATGYKLPFNKQILTSINTPVFFHGVGINIFRGGIPYSAKAKQALQETIDYSGGFSVRNDGSFEKIRDWIQLDTTNVDVIPDPGLLYLDQVQVPQKEFILKGGFQPAFNSSPGINRERFGSDDNIEWTKQFSKQFICYPHTPKDYGRIPATPVVDHIEFGNTYVKTPNTLKFLELYKKVDYVVAMRGHGQLITIGMNVPGLYFTTQDKVRDFSLLNGYQDYNIDIQEPDWKTKLATLNEKIKNDRDYQANWYEITKNNMPIWYKMNSDFVLKNKKKHGL